MTEAEWQESYEPVELLEALPEGVAVERLRQYALFCLREVGAGRSADLLERHLAGLVEWHEIEAHRIGFHGQAQWTSGGGYSLGRKPVHLSSATQRARAIVAGLQAEPRLSAFAITRETLHLLQRMQCAWLRCLFVNPFRPVTFSPNWRTDTAVVLARAMYESRDFGAMPILADALQDAGCDNEGILSHCRSSGPHVRGCWVVDLVLAKE
jgi:hypothetical protein